MIVEVLRSFVVAALVAPTPQEGPPPPDPESGVAQEVQEVQENGTGNGDDPTGGDHGSGDEGAQTRRPDGLLDIARREADRTRARLAAEIRGILQDIALLPNTYFPQVRKGIAKVVAHGPDALPMLMEWIEGARRPRDGEYFELHAVRAVLGIFEATQDLEILRNLRALATQGDWPTQLVVLAGFDEIDHDLVAHTLIGLVGHEDERVHRAALRALGAQASNARVAVPALRTVLTQEGATGIATTIDSLRRLEDRESEQTVIDLLKAPEDPTGTGAAPAQVVDPALVEAGVYYLAELGSRHSFPTFRRLLFQDLPSQLATVILQGVQGIGLDQIETKAEAEKLLVHVYKNHPAASVKVRAARLLGPFQNEGAYQYLVEPLQVRVSRRGGSTVDNQIDIALLQLLFERWKDAEKTLRNATVLDSEKGARQSDILTYQAIARAGQQDYSTADKLLRRSGKSDFSGLVQEWPPLRAMSRDPRYQHHFGTGR